METIPRSFGSMVEDLSRITRRQTAVHHLTRQGERKPISNGCEIYPAARKIDSTVAGA
jgi:hypothetical protein